MNTGPDSPDGTPTGGQPAEEDTLAEVLRRFTFGGGRRTRRHRYLQRSPKHAESPGPQQEHRSHQDNRPHQDNRAQQERGPQPRQGPEPRPAFWPTQEPQVESRPATPVADERIEPETVPSQLNEAAQPNEASQTNEADEPDEAAAYIRPYAWTGGRTRSNHRFELETLISTSELAQMSRLERLEHQSIADLCRHPRSVAEVGAVLGVPLGVARVLLGDLADLGLITVHRTVTENGSTSHLMLMERVLSGLRRL